MKFDFDQVLTDYDEQPMLRQTPTADGKGFELKEMRLRDAAFTALNTVVDSDARLDGTEKMKLHTLAMKIVKGEDFDVEDTALLLRRIGQMPNFGALIVGRCNELLATTPAVPPKKR